MSADARWFASCVTPSRNRAAWDRRSATRGEARIVPSGVGEKQQPRVARVVICTTWRQPGIGVIFFVLFSGIGDLRMSNLPKRSNPVTKGARVLVVDDDSDGAEAAGKLLETFG